MKKNNNWLTVCTPTYNRAQTLERTYDSLERQTLKNFNWMIIDDGSNDETKSVVKKLKKNASFNIEYVYKENGGRHTALNLAYTLINTEYVLNLDSDDELTDNAIELLRKAYDTMCKRQDYSRFWLISGRCIDSQTLKPTSEKFANDINEFVGKNQSKKIAMNYGEKCNCRKVEILKNFPFPIYEGIKFVPEDIVWERVNKYYDQYCINDILRIYHTESEDSLCNGSVHSETKWKSAYLLYIFYINECFNHIFLVEKLCKYLIIPVNTVFISISKGLKHSIYYLFTTYD